MGRERVAYVQKLDASRMSEVALTERIVGLEQSRLSALTAAQNYVEMGKQKVLGERRKVDAAEQTLRTSELNLDRVKRLHERGLRSKRDLELVELDYAKASAELDRSRAELASSQEDLEAKEAQLQKTDADTRASLESARSSLASARSSVASNEAAVQQIDMKLARHSDDGGARPSRGNGASLAGAAWERVRQGRRSARAPRTRLG